VSESEIAELARRLYIKHRRALDLIYEHRPDRQSEVAEILRETIRQEPTLEMDHCSKGYIRFCAKAWDGIPNLMLGRGWTESGRLLLFEFKNTPERLGLYLLIGPTAKADENVRQQAFASAQREPWFYKKHRNSKLSEKWMTIWKREFLSEKDYDETSSDELKRKIADHWSRFVHNDMQQIVNSVSKWVSTAP